MPFSGFNLLPELSRALEAVGFVTPTPIQERAIPPCLEGFDVLGSAQTGSGKTVAFVLPMLQALLAERQEHAAPPPPPPARGPAEIRALVLVPTRELAAQVEKAVKDLARFSPMRCALIIGGESFPEQVQALRRGAAIAVATPGRLLDHVRSRTLSLGRVRLAVLDEADRMLDMGFIPDIRRIMQALPRERQTLMFSATIPAEVERIVREFMDDPFRVQIDRPTSPAAGISQRLYPVTQDQKQVLLLALLKTEKISSALIFARTKSRADILGRFLQAQGIAVAVLHADRTQAQRTQAMESFRDRRHQILVATDIASRGLDVRHISHVINFDVPQHPEDYVHRIGRTGRHFNVGDAITLMGLDEQRFISAVESYIGQEIPRTALEGFPYRVPPLLTSHKTRLTDRFRVRRQVARSSRMRFRR